MEVGVLTQERQLLKLSKYTYHYSKVFTLPFSTIVITLNNTTSSLVTYRDMVKFSKFSIIYFLYIEWRGNWRYKNNIQIWERLL